MPSRQRFINPWLALAGTALFASGTSGCAPDCGDEQTIRYEQGTTNAAHTQYWTTPVTGPLLHFPPNRTYQLVHGLKAEPTNVVINLSFQAIDGNLAPGAGNQSLWRPEAGAILLENDTCAEFYVHVFASTDLAADPADAATD